MGRHVFYNNSAWDDVSDDDAIDSTKIALLPGQSGSSANYTNYSRGINGIMVDIDSPTGTPNETDFAIEINQSDDADAWSSGPTPTVAVRPGDGVGGSDRVVLAWPDGQIANQWVKVTVLATARTGLASEDVFAFGNVIGDIDGDGAINETDLNEFISEFGSRGGFGALDADFDADGRVGLRDFAVVRSRFGDSVDAPTFPAEAPVAAPITASAVLPETSPTPSLLQSVVENGSDIIAESVGSDGDTAATNVDSCAEAAALMFRSSLSVGVGEFVSASSSETSGRVTTVPYRVATAKCGLLPPSGDLETGEAEELLADILAESALVLPL